MLSIAVGASWEETPSEGACADECGPARRKGRSGLATANVDGLKTAPFLQRAGGCRQAGRQAGRLQAGLATSSVAGVMRQGAKGDDGSRGLGGQVGERGTASEVVTAHNLRNDTTGFRTGDAGRPRGLRQDSASDRLSRSGEGLDVLAVIRRGEGQDECPTGRRNTV